MKDSRTSTKRSTKKATNNRMAGWLSKSKTLALRPYNASVRNIKSLKARRPHRSFKLTRRRDYVRSLRLPGYLSFTKYVTATLISRRKVFIKLVLFYALAIVIFGGITNQEMYTAIGSTVRDASQDVLTGSWGKVGEAGLLLVSAFGGGSGQATIDQQIYLAIALLLVWLTTVWLLREILAGRKPKVRDGLYSSGSPFVSTLLIFMYAALQLIPLAIIVVAYSGLAQIGLIDQGFGSMLFYIFSSIIVVMVFYWITSTIVAGVVVTLPGMYPGRALSIAGDLVVGRRVRILLRLLWMIGVAILMWAVIAIPIVLLNDWLKSVWSPFENIPLVPIVAAILSSTVTVWCSAYVYLLYRKIVDDDASPS